jgi:hypothetical protein
VLAYLVVYHETGQPLLAAAAFPIGFIALLLARKRAVHRDNFLVPVTARIRRPRLVAATGAPVGRDLAAKPGRRAGHGRSDRRRATGPAIGRRDARPSLRTLGVSWRSLLLAVLAGSCHHPDARMQHASDDLGPKLVAGVAMLVSRWVAAAACSIRVLDSILMFHIRDCSAPRPRYMHLVATGPRPWAGRGFGTPSSGGIGLVDVPCGWPCRHRTGLPRNAPSRARTALLLLLQQGIGELEQVGPGQHGQGVDGEPWIARGT